MALDKSRIGLHVAHKQLQQGGFPASVLAHHRVSGAHLNIHIQVGQAESTTITQLRLWVSETHLIHLDQVGNRFWVLERELKGGILGNLLEHGKPLQRLNTGLDQTGPLGITPEGIDEFVEMSLGPLLGLRLTLLDQQLIGPDFLERIVVPLVVGELLIPEVNNIRANGIQEIPSMGHDNQGSRALRQVLFQPSHRVEVQMVSGLVQQEEIRVSKKCAGQRHAHAPPSGQMAKGLGLHVRGQSEPCQDLRSLVGGGGSIHLLQPLVNSREPGRILRVGSFGGVHSLTENLLLSEKVPSFLVHHEDNIQGRNQIFGQVVQLLFHRRHHQ
mmetsp:Transcript_41585/g.90649  ORF Transcript_41585/g.90649 Transcript_41585/m.90649 type:complete len:328 (+) Transcript_41585:595-1578(+)